MVGYSVFMKAKENDREFITDNKPYGRLREPCYSLKMLVVNLTAYPLFVGFVSGGEQHMLEVCKNCRVNGYELAVLTSESGVNLFNLSGISAKTYVISVPFEKILCKSLTGLVLIYIIRMFKSLFKALSLDEQFDVVCSFSNFLADVLPATIVSWKKPESKMVTYIHHLEPLPAERAKYHRLLPSILIWISQSASLSLIKKHAHVIFVNPLDEERVVELGASRERIKVMSQGINCKRINHAKRMNKDWDACYLGRLAPFKAFDLIDVWKNVCQFLPGARLAVIGTELEEYVSEFKNRIKRNNLENNIELLGALPEVKKYAVLKACKVFVFPSYEEGWGIAVCEAMACGLPVVAYDLPAYKVFNDAITKVAVGDKDAFSEAVLRFLSNMELRAEISEKAKQMTNQLDWNTIVERELNIIKSST